MTVTAPTRLTFELPPELEAGEPPEARGLTRDAVRMMVAYRSTDLAHAQHVRAAPGVPRAGRPRGREHVGHDPRRGRRDHADRRAPRRAPLDPARRAPVGRRAPQARRSLHRTLARRLTAASCSSARPRRCRSSSRTSAAVASGSPTLDLPQPVLTWLTVHGRPIRYGYVERPWPLSAYQNVYVTEPGSAEMPSAGRPFTPEVITRLVAKGVGVTPIVLHTGVASLEADELPYPEHARVPAVTAMRVNATHDAGGRVVAVGTTVVRALESAVDDAGRARVRRLDRARHHARARRARRRRSAHRLARTRGVAPPDARSGRRTRAARTVVRREPRRGLPVARVRRPAPHPAGGGGLGGGILRGGRAQSA